MGGVHEKPHTLPAAHSQGWGVLHGPQLVLLTTMGDNVQTAAPQLRVRASLAGGELRQKCEMVCGPDDVRRVLCVEAWSTGCCECHRMLSFT